MFLLSLFYKGLIATSLQLLFDYNLLFDYINFTMIRVHYLLIIYNNLSNTITHEQRCEPHPQMIKRQEKNTRSGSKEKKGNCREA